MSTQTVVPRIRAAQVEEPPVKTARVERKWLRVRGWLWPVAVLACGACGEDFDPASLVSDFRVMAIAATPPQIPLTGAAELTALTHSPTPTITYAWSACLVGVNSALGYQCADPAFECDLGTEATASLNPVSLLETCLADAELSPELLEAAGISPEEAEDFDLAAFFAEERTVQVKLRAASGDKTIDATKTVIVGGVPPLNNNPTIGDILLDDEPWAPDSLRELEPATKYELRVSVTEPSREVYTDDEGNEVTEEILYAFFATDGDMEGNFANDTVESQTWKSPKLDPGDDPLTVSMWIVARDGRGGTHWVSREVVVKAPPAEEQP